VTAILEYLYLAFLQVVGIRITEIFDSTEFSILAASMKIKKQPANKFNTRITFARFHYIHMISSLNMSDGFVEVL